MPRGNFKPRPKPLAPVIDHDEDEMVLLQPMQEAFVKAYVVEGLPVYEAMAAAGYATTIPKAQLLKNKQVQARIRQVQAEVNSRNAVTFESHVNMLAKIRDLAIGQGQLAVAHSAEKSRGQVAGLYIDRKEIMHGVIDSMSKEEILKEIERITKENPALLTLIATNPTEEQQILLAGKREDDEKA